MEGLIALVKRAEQQSTFTELQRDLLEITNGVLNEYATGLTTRRQFTSAMNKLEPMLRRYLS